MPKFEGTPIPPPEEPKKPEEISKSKELETGKQPVEAEDVSEKEIRETEEKLERRFGKRLKCFAYWTSFGAIVSVSAFIIPRGINEMRWSRSSQQFSQDYQQDLAQWKNYISENFDREHLAENERKIREIFGEEEYGAEIILGQINSGDLDAFRKRTWGAKRQKPTLVGFDEATEQFISNILDTLPKNWVNGEVSFMEKVDTLDNIAEDKNTIYITTGRHLKRSSKATGSQNKIIFYHNPTLGSENDITARTIYHELAHANDWTNDLDLSLIERQQLLLMVVDLMSRPDSFASHSTHSAFAKYRKNFGVNQEDKEGLYNRAVEYWAEICMEYFCDPEGFKENFPREWGLVHHQLLKQKTSD